MSSNHQQSVDIPLDEYIFKMNITSSPPKSPEISEANSEPSDSVQRTLRTVSERSETPKPANVTTPRSSLLQATKPKVSFRSENPDLQRDGSARNRLPYQASADARNRIQQLRNQRRQFPELGQGSGRPTRPSIVPPSSMQRQAAVATGPSWEQMLPYEQLQQMATTTYFLSMFFNLPPPPPFNDPALFRR